MVMPIMPLSPMTMNSGSSFLIFRSSSGGTVTPTMFGMVCAIWFMV